MASLAGKSEEDINNLPFTKTSNYFFHKYKKEQNKQTNKQNPQKTKQEKCECAS